MKLSKILTLSLVLGISSGVWAQDTQVTASVSSDTVGVQDQFRLHIVVSGKDAGDAENPRISHLRDFRVVSGPSVSSQYQWINGRTSSSKSFIYVLIPEKEGQFTIDPVEVKVGEKIYKTQPVQINVTSASQSPLRQQQRPFNPFDPFEEEDAQSRIADGNAVLVKAELDRGSAYPGQQVTLSYNVYTQVGITGIQLQENPPLSGFWVEDLEVDKNPKGSRRTLNGREYMVYTIRKQALFATAAGTLKIPSSVFAISASTAGGFLGGFSRTETLYRKTEELLLDVKPLPSAGRPAGFSNAVGTFNLTAGIDKAQVATGEAVAFHIKLEGRGNLKMIPDISIPQFPDFTIYSSKRADNIRPFPENQIGGDKTWEYVIVPKAPGRHTIPELSFSYFNAAQNKYETVTTPALSLDVVRGADAASSVSGLSGSGKQDLVRRGTDINFIKSSIGDLGAGDRPLYRQFWFYLMAAIPLFFNAGIFLFQRHRSRLAGNIRYVRMRGARRRALDRLKIAEREANSEARRFYDQAAAALSGYLTDRFSLSDIEVTGDTLERALSKSSIPPETVMETRACLQECDFGRFVAASASAGKIRELGARIRKNIDDLESAAR